jgi:serpin B
MIRFRHKRWIITCCAAAMLLLFAAATILIAVRSPPAPVADDGVKALSGAYNSFGQELSARFAASPGNVVFSPYSIGTAMALALSGSRGETESEMTRVLKHRLARTEIDDANGKALAILNQYGRGYFSFWKPTAARLMTANAVMLAKHGDMISKDYLARLQASYAAEVFQNVTAAAVNDWVSRKTERKIDKIVDELDPGTVAVLINAIYFKSSWALPFDGKLTQTEKFEISPSQTVSVPIMHREADYSTVVAQEYSAIRLPYQDPQLHMVIVLPDRTSELDAVGASLDGAALSRLFAQLQGPAHKTELALPRFKTSFDVKLKQHFRALGMTKPFEPANADFSGMTGGRAANNPIVIHEVLHQAVIDVSEEGTEAAAATTVFMLSSWSSPRTFHVTRPFLFYIVDDATNAILFQGRIIDPRA